jgi:hypothetical protein
METELDGSQRTLTALRLRDGADPEIILPHPTSVSNLTPKRPANGSAPSQFQREAECRSDPTTPTPIRNKTHGRVPGYAIALQRVKAVQRSAEKTSETRPLKRQRVSQDATPQHDRGGRTNRGVAGLNLKPNQSFTSTIGAQHLDLFYLTHRDLKYCRSCLCVFFFFDGHNVGFAD